MKQAERLHIPLGFEVGTGAPVSIPLDHLIITGRTQAAGKTTTLEALVERSGLRALTFLTKRGEGSFRSSRSIRPYWHNLGGWRFVASVLEATVGEKLKRERAEIIRAATGAASLQEVYRRIVAKRARARSSWVQDILLQLETYLDEVLPALDSLDLASELAIGPGINVVDMLGADYSDHLRALLIRSAMEWVLKRETGVIVVVPEAWRFIPAALGNPVKAGCMALIREGGALNNWVALDSQEISAVDAQIRKSIGVWICGVQRETNEVKRVIAHLSGKPKPTPDEIMSLGVGQFYVSHGSGVTRQVYVQPAWMDADQAIAIATNDFKSCVAVVPVPELVQEPRAEPRPADNPEEEINTVSLEPKLDLQLAKLDAILDELRLLRTTNRHDAGVEIQASQGATRNIPAVDLSGGIESLYEKFRTRLLTDPAVMKVVAMIKLEHPRIELDIQHPTISMDGASLKGRIARLIHAGFFDKPVRSASVVRKELKRTGGDSPESNIRPVLQEYQKYGFLTFEETGWQAVTARKSDIVAKA